VNRINAGIADLAPDANRVLVGMPPADETRRTIHAITTWRAAK